MKRSMVLLALFIILVVTAAVSLTLGRFSLSIGDLAGALGFHAAGGPFPSGGGGGPGNILTTNILIDIRLPRITAAILIGAALSVSGTAYQSMFMNPLVSPGILGVLAGASFGAALGMVMGKTWWIVQLSAFASGLIAVAATLAFAALNRRDRLLMLILGGIISGSLFTSLLSIVKYLADPYEQLPAIIYWLMGTLSAIDRMTVTAVSSPIIIGVALLLLLSGYLNVLSMGDEEAQALGVNVVFLRYVFIFLATVISALTVVMGGIIAWVGLIIPHVSRMIVGPDNRVLLPASALIGATYLLIADNIARLAFSVEIPIGILTSLIGIPFFAFILRKSGKGWH